MSGNPEKQYLLETPRNVPGGYQYEHLAYIAAYDAVLELDYAFVAYRETESDNKWRVRIQSSNTAGAELDPLAMRKKARATTAQGKSWFPWGYSFDPSPEDSRCIQFRVHVAESIPTEVEIFVQLRKSDGTADAPVSVKFAWPAIGDNTTFLPLLETPANVPQGAVYQHLAYLEAYDAVIDSDYAFVAYKETDSYGWKVRIKSSQIPGAEFDPAFILNQARSAAAQGKPWFQWGYSFDPSPEDPRTIQFRVHVEDGVPSEVEIFVQLRKFDGTADAPKSVKFRWPL